MIATTKPEKRMREDAAAIRESVIYVPNARRRICRDAKRSSRRARRRFDRAIIAAY